MKITHIALWTEKLEELRTFYLTYFKGKSNEKYTNSKKGFESYFISFQGETSLEIMRSVHVTTLPFPNPHIGLCHFAFSLANREEVDSLTERLRSDGYTVLSEPRITGDGFYESVILDPDSNQVELVTK